MDEDSQKEVAITYDVLYDLSRREKDREELQGIDCRFFADVLTYLREKEQLFEEAKSKNDLFSVNDRDKLQTQLYNIKRLVRELYERREKKIIGMAVNKSRIGSDVVDTTNLLAQERQMFEQLVQELDYFRKNILVNILELREPLAAAEPEKPPVAEHREKKEKKTTMVKFVSEVAQFVGPELEAYGPFSADDRAYLPAEIAGILIGKGSAVEIEEDEF